MNERYKNLTSELADELLDTTFEFLTINLKKSEGTGKLLDLILSGHLSSLFTCMTAIAADLGKDAYRVSNFIDELQKILPTLTSISMVEVL